jgi:hypothetical protein
MPSGMTVKEMTGMIAPEELVAMVGVGITHIAVLLAQYIAHGLVLTTVAAQVLYMVHMAGAEVLFVIAIRGNTLGLFSLVCILALLAMT